MPPKPIIIFGSNQCKVSFDESEIIKCEAYANAILNRSFTPDLIKFKKVDPIKFLYDHTIGKLGEIAAQKYLQSVSIPTNPIDFDIRSLDEVKSIGHDADLISSEMDLHVKSCRVLSPFPESYCFSLYDRCAAEPTERDYLCAVRVDYRGIDYTVAKIRALLPLQLIREKDLFKMPIKGTQQDLTRFIYAEDLPALVPAA